MFILGLILGLLFGFFIGSIYYAFILDEVVNAFNEVKDEKRENKE
jgi:hypothetical protein